MRPTTASSLRLVGVTAAGCQCGDKVDRYSAGNQLAQDDGVCIVPSALAERLTRSILINGASCRRRVRQDASQDAWEALQCASQSYDCQT